MHEPQRHAQERIVLAGIGLIVVIGLAVVGYFLQKIF